MAPVKRNFKVSVIGPLTDASKVSSPSPLNEVETLPPKMDVGLSVVMLTTPADALLPNRVVCGPRRTSICDTSDRLVKAWD